MIIITFLFRNLHLDVNVHNDASEEGIRKDGSSATKESVEWEPAQSMEDLWENEYYYLSGYLWIAFVIPLIIYSEL